VVKYTMLFIKGVKFNYLCLYWILLLVWLVCVIIF